MTLDQMVVIILPIVLFIINLIIILVFRASDSKKRGLTNVRKLTDQYKNEIESRSNAFEVKVEEIERRFGRQDQQLKDLMNTANSELESIKNYNDDMSNLRHSMDTYREALAGLAKLTTDADSKISQIEKDVLRLENVQNIIDSFRLDMNDADAHLKQYETSVIQLQNQTVGQLENSIKSFKVDAEKTLEETKAAVFSFNSALDEKIEATKMVTGQLHTSSVEILQNIGDRLADQHTLSKQIVELSKAKEELSRNLEILNQQIDEKRQFVSQLDQIAREENEKLSLIKNSINTYNNAKSTYIESSVEQVSDSEKKEDVVPEIVRSAEQAKPEETYPIEDSNDEVLIEQDSDIEYYGKEEEIVF